MVQPSPPPKTPAAAAPPAPQKPAVTPATPAGTAATLRVDCPQCGKSLKIPRELAGKHGKCPECGTSILVPAAGDSGGPTAAPVAAVSSPAMPRAAAPVAATLPTAAPNQTTPAALATFAVDLRCEHCGCSNPSRKWPARGDLVSFHCQKESGSHALEMNCPHCHRTWYVVWDENPGPVGNIA
ncbi:MAG: hypothetical protein HYS13_06555 [Planctomycetia bacterium]|nr:hypothetical protein [Planctomycetia bacterium]